MSVITQHLPPREDTNDDNSYSVDVYRTEIDPERTYIKGLGKLSDILNKLRERQNGGS